MSDWFSGPWQWDDVLRSAAFVFVFILLPLAFVVFGVVSLALVAHCHVWCAWALTLAGPLVGVGTFFRNAYSLRYAVHPAPPPAPCAGLIDLGATLTAHAIFTLFCRLMRSVIPPDSHRLVAWHTRLVYVGYALLLLSSPVVVLAWFRPEMRVYGPLLQLPFFLYFEGVSHYYFRISSDWVTPEGHENQPLLPTNRAPRRMRLFQITAWTMVVLMSRAIVNLGLGFAGYWELVDYGSGIDDFALFLCYMALFRGLSSTCLDWELPAEYRVFRLKQEEDLTDEEPRTTSLPLPTAVAISSTPNPRRSSV